jgi:biotin synthase
MAHSISDILEKSNFSREDLVMLLSAGKEDRQLIYAAGEKAKAENVGKVVYFRGLVEFSNICGKNCYYCGIRKDNKNLERYNLKDEEILSAVRFAWENNYASVVLQSGELESPAFTRRIDKLLNEIKKMTKGEIGITLSCGEQTPEVYKQWYNSGGHRYLLRIEASNPELYAKIHPSDKKHDHKRRLECLRSLKEIGYQTGTGVMVGLPFQTYEDMADDILFMKDFDIDMVGLGPYIEHKDTPLIAYKDQLLPAEERFHLALKMIAILRIMMKDINIAAATAMQAIDPMGREKALKVGANVIMPNITPGKYRNSYKLYENKPCTDEEAEDCSSCLEARIHIVGDEIGYGKWGDSKHYFRRKEK